VLTIAALLASLHTRPACLAQPDVPTGGLSGSMRAGKPTRNTRCFSRARACVRIDEMSAVPESARAPDDVQAAAMRHPPAEDAPFYRDCTPAMMIAHPAPGLLSIDDLTQNGVRAVLQCPPRGLKVYHCYASMGVHRRYCRVLVLQGIHDIVLVCVSYFAPGYVE